jgi:pimeloyl-ACP methyl ester carboxylesterase
MARMTTAPTSFVLVHGAWAGAHGFRKVRPLLRAAGHDVTTPSLTGLGERVHLTGPQVDLSTHIADVVNHVLYEDLSDIVLLGFSYGGMVVTGALEHIGDRVRHLVYLDAFVPGDGDSVRTLIGAPLSAPIQLGADWAVAAAPREYDDPADAAWADARRVPHPGRCFVEPVRLLRPLEEQPFTRTYIKATADAPDAPGNAVFTRIAEHAKSSPAWRYREVATNHLIPENRPEELAQILLELVPEPS